MTKRFGFTLAEVLITLGIIGVVAAMTIPTLIANTNGAKFRSQFKKSISTLNQAGLMGQAQYDFDYAGAGACSDTNPQSDDPESQLTVCGLFNGTLTGYTAYTDLSNLKKSDGNAYSVSGTNVSLDDKYVYALADGSLVAFPSGMKECTIEAGTQVNSTTLGAALKDCIGFIDVNGTTLPNKEVTCSDGSTTGLTPDTPCTVKNDAAHMTDIFPIVFHDSTVEPATNAAKYILTTSK
jgi:prepilin-type N-terminal cleavage/methylation domain-containing protein